MEWVLKSPEKAMAYIKWQEQKTASKTAKNKDLTEETERKKAANKELRRVVGALE